MRGVKRMESLELRTVLRWLRGGDKHVCAWLPFDHRCPQALPRPFEKSAAKSFVSYSALETLMTLPLWPTTIGKDKIKRRR